MWRTSILHCHKEGKINDLWWPWPLRCGHQKKTLYIPGYVLDICAKNDADPDSGLGGVYETSYTQTDGFTLLWYRWFIKKDNLKSLFFHNEKLKNTIHTSKAQCQVHVIFQMHSLVEYD